MWVKGLALILALFGPVWGQIDIHEKPKDGMYRIPVNETEGTSEIYTSMHQLNKFFEEEKDMVEDIKMIIEKKLVSQAAVTGTLKWHFSGGHDRHQKSYQALIYIFLNIQRLVLSDEVLNIPVS